ncbi:MAG: 4Fe-4S binding protein [Alphaproteobacteria bacterium]|uniref:4Fe-4S binding protein n=1 Tax=Candidatus Nitrobium versatile TaxID=2884831 RepID=A0A953J3H3_9BACT|nr:4Fe-4S binding protein [Candidatus Nitrobium versatile]
MSRRRTIRSLRQVAGALQAVVMVGLPFLKINGESALRFDIPTLRLHVFGCTLWMQEFFLVLIATIFLTLLALFITLVFGRIWCGWLCPQTVLTDLTPFVDRAGGKGPLLTAAAYAATFLISAVVAASLIWYFVSPYEFLPALSRGTLGTTTWGFWTVMTLGIFLNYAFLRHKWCATACPYAKLQSVLFDKSTLIIELDPKRAAECIDCRRCEKVCPTGISIRRGMDAACINCAECIDACNAVMGRFNRKGLLRYAFGSGGEGKILRQNFFVVGGFVLLFFGLSLYFTLARTGVDVTVLPHTMGPRLTREGKIINAYVLAVKNMQDRPVELKVTVEKFDDSLVQSITVPLRLEAEKADKVPLFVRVAKRAGMKGSRKITITLDDVSGKIHIAKEANFVIPDEL